MLIVDETKLSDPIAQAISELDDANEGKTDGQWLEDMTVAVGPLIMEWDLRRAYHWAQWPKREQIFPGSTREDLGIDVVGERRSDGRLVAIQCKAYHLDEDGRGHTISKGEIDSFANASSSAVWAERWLVTNGDNPMGRRTRPLLSETDQPIKMVNIAADLHLQGPAPALPDPAHDGPGMSKNRMQDEAVATAVRVLREHELVNSGGIPMGEARGRIILPCGTGKTRISLRIVETLTPQRNVSVVLCPSIALVAQIRREYLQNATVPIRALAVCSDQTAGYSGGAERVKNVLADPTADVGYVSAAEVKGMVTTDAETIAGWIAEGERADAVSVIFGTYQSSHRVAAALKLARARVRVLVCDEAHRTAGLRRRRGKDAAAAEQKIRDFTLCHDQEAFPATYRVYQTATPRIYDTAKRPDEKEGDYLVRSMDDQSVFGVELYRKSYVEAVENGWLSDYRIIAVGIQDQAAYDAANELAERSFQEGKKSLTSYDYLRGLALALTMGGAVYNRERDVPVQSCIAFMNTVNKSEDMAEKLQTDTVRRWVQRWLDENAGGQSAAGYSLEHLDARSNVTARDNAKRKLAEANLDRPHGVINVGIFGEGTDSPSLSAVAFLEPRKSPIDVIQAVGRAMRTAPGKEMGYIICPIPIPLNEDPEEFLQKSTRDQGWQELGQILVALRSHDQRIEDNLEDLLYLYLPSQAEVERAVVAVALNEGRRIQYGEYEGPPGGCQEAVELVLSGQVPMSEKFSRIGARPSDEWQLDEPTKIISGKRYSDGAVDVRMDDVARSKPVGGAMRGPVDYDKTKERGRKMVNEGAGHSLVPASRRKSVDHAPDGAERQPRAEREAFQMLLLSGMEDHGHAIKMNLLARSGLGNNRMERDRNILQASVMEAARSLKEDGLQSLLDRHFGLDQLDEKGRADQADGCTIAALLMMNAAMLHQRISNGGWLAYVNSLSGIKNDAGVVGRVRRQWENIMRHDFHAVLEPAVEAIYAVEEAGQLSGLEQALHHLTGEAERIAETYADMGADHAGLLFNQVMGNQASDGAYFTRPVAASIAARLTLDACGDVDWTDPAAWRRHKTVDLACGSGTLLAAMLTDMKRRARERGADDRLLGALQKLAVEETVKGLDINPVSLQLAASQLTQGNHETRYRRMGLHLMPYGPRKKDPDQVAVGTLELLGQKAIVPRPGQLDFADEAIGSESVWSDDDDVELEDAVDAVKDARIVIMNPPFTNRHNMGEKFPVGTRRTMRRRADGLEAVLVNSDPDMSRLGDKNSIEPLFAALSDRCLEHEAGVLTMVNPTIALTASSALNKRRQLAQRYHIHTVVTCHQPRQLNLSQNTSINESIVVARRHDGPKPPTRFINLDRMPLDDADVQDLHDCLNVTDAGGDIGNGWGVVSFWPSERMEAGDWTAAVLRSDELARAAATFVVHSDLAPMDAILGLSVHGQDAPLRKTFEQVEPGTFGSLPILKSKGAHAQTTITSAPDEHWAPKTRNLSNGEEQSEVARKTELMLEKAGYLLVTAGQRTGTARLTAVAGDDKYIGTGWLPVTGLSPDEAKAMAVFVNSTAGRLQLLRQPGRTLEFPQYVPAAIEKICVPNVKNPEIRDVLADCWERTKGMTVPQFREGECDVRRLWDEAVAVAMGWDPDELTRIRLLLHQEPHVSGLGYNEYGDEIAD